MVSKRALRPRAYFSGLAALVLAGFACSLSMAAGAETRIGGVVGSDEKTVASLSLQLAALQMRVKKLEGGLQDIQRSLRKADTPDDSGSPDKKEADGGGKATSGQGGNDSSAAGAGKSGSSATDSGTSGVLKDVFPTMTLRAPFVVVDSSGKAIFRVNDPRAKSAKAVGDRGV